MDTNLTSDFNAEAAAPPKTAFVGYLMDMFQSEGTQAVLQMFEKLGLPPPADQQEFLQGAEGAIVLFNRFGLVIRIENRIAQGEKSDRVNNSPWIVKPLASIYTGDCVIEICPAFMLEKEPKNNKLLIGQLKAEQIKFWDDGLHNIARVPLKTPHFPEGIPIVIDRMAVRRFSSHVAPVRDALQTAQRKEAIEAMDRFYSQLQSVFDAGWSLPSGPEQQTKMKEFFKLCHRFVQEGLLGTAWNELQPKAKPEYAEQKILTAAQSAKAYDARLSGQEQGIQQTPRMPQP